MFHRREWTNLAIVERLETSSAIVERVNPDLVICRYKPGVLVNSAAVRENLEARKRFPGKEAYAVIGYFPEDADFDMSLLDADHYKEVEVTAVTSVLAIVAVGALFDNIAKLFFAYHPQGFATRVFRTMPEAEQWVQERIALRDSA